MAIHETYQRTTLWSAVTCHRFGTKAPTSRRTPRRLPQPYPVVAIQRRCIRDDDSVAFLQAVENLDHTDGVAAELDLSPLRFRPIGRQHKHPDGLLCLSKCWS